MNIDLRFGCYNHTVTWGIGPVVTPNPVAVIKLWPCVPDQVRGYYQYNGTNFVPVPKPNQYKRIALIIESPHKAEFDANFCPIAPLNGTSGARFAKNILAKLHTWFTTGTINNDDCFEVYIMNPVQYQTSLYHFLNDMISWNPSGNTTQYEKIDHSLRNDVWKFLFDTCWLKHEFLYRLICYNPAYIINCCTGGNNAIYNTFRPINQIRCCGTSLKSCVKNEIVNGFKKERPNVYYLQHKHPISWP